MKELIIAFGLFFYRRNIVCLISIKNEKYVKKNGVNKGFAIKKWWFGFCSYRFYNYLVYKKLK